MTRKLLAPVCIGLLMAISSISFAQRTADEAITMAVRVVDSSANNDIPVLSNKGKQSRQRSSERLRHRDRALTKAPEPLDTKKYAALTGKSMPVPTPTLDVQAGETPRLEHLRLSARHNFSGFGWLDLNEVRHLDARVDYVMFYTATDPFMAWTRAHLKVDAGERYLIDFSVTVSNETTFTIGTSGNTSNQTVAKGSHHLLVFLDAEQTKTTLVSLISDNANYTFHELNVTRVN